MLLSQDERRLIWKQMDATKNRKFIRVMKL